MSSTLRPDELAAQAEIERAQSRNQALKGPASTALKLGAAAFGGGIASRVLPLLNDYIPIDLAMKGINMISPKLGAFLKKGQSKGLDLKEGFDFIKDKIGKAAEPAKEETQKASPGSILGKYNQKLASFIESSLQQGIPIAKAAWLAKYHPEFTKDVMKIEKDTNTKFQDFIMDLYKGALPKQGQAQPQEQMRQPQQGQAQQGQPQQGGGDQALLAAFNKILQM